MRVLPFVKADFFKIHNIAIWFLVYKGVVSATTSSLSLYISPVLLRSDNGKQSLDPEITKDAESIPSPIHTIWLGCFAAISNWHIVVFDGFPLSWLSTKTITSSSQNLYTLSAPDDRCVLQGFRFGSSRVIVHPNYSRSDSRVKWCSNISPM